MAGKKDKNGKFYKHPVGTYNGGTDWASLTRDKKMKSSPLLRRSIGKPKELRGK